MVICSYLRSQNRRFLLFNSHYKKMTSITGKNHPCVSENQWKTKICFVGVYNNCLSISDFYFFCAWCCHCNLQRFIFILEKMVPNLRSRITVHYYSFISIFSLCLQNHPKKIPKFALSVNAHTHTHIRTTFILQHTHTQRERHTYNTSSSLLLRTNQVVRSAVC